MMKSEMGYERRTAIAEALFKRVCELANMAELGKRDVAHTLTAGIVNELATLDAKRAKRVQDKLRTAELAEHFRKLPFSA